MKYWKIMSQQFHPLFMFICFFLSAFFSADSPCVPLMLLIVEVFLNFLFASGEKKKIYIITIEHRSRSSSSGFADDM
jgi:hypothetical protein